MKINQLHEWNLSPENAKAVQKNLRAWIINEDQFSFIKTIARIKVKTFKNEALVKASISVLSYPDLKLIEKKSASCEATFPAVRGLASFRQAPAVIKAFESIQKIPDLIICDGEGIIDDTAFGLASHIGLLTHKPTIGIKKPAKDSVLIQSIENVRGAWLPIPVGDTVIGSLVRVVEGIEPIQASPGHAISVSSAVKFVLDYFPKEVNKKSEESEPTNINDAKKKVSA